MADLSPAILARLREYCARRFDAELLSAELLRPDAGGATTAKVEGYGDPVRLRLRQPNGEVRQCVFHTARSNAFGHDRRSDRALQQLLAWDTFPTQPRHVGALDVGAIDSGGGLSSLRESGEFFLVTDWADGTPYADDLRRLAHGAAVSAVDLERARALALHLAGLHQRLPPDAIQWERSLRDTVGSGEGIFGICDAYGTQTPGAPPSLLLELEQRANAWRWRLKPREGRLSRTHGDFHPFNLVFRAGTDFTALDASRGCAGEPADDLCALAVNYVFFAIEHRAQWAPAFARLWHGFWDTYLKQTGDDAALECAAPFLAWRLLVVACPRFYPHLSPASREALLGLAQRALEAPRFDPAMADRLFQ